MNNIFENAYFGKTYITKDNTIVKFILQDKDFILLYIPKCKYSIETTHRYNQKGEFYLGNGEYGHSSLDIISEWPVSEEELDRLANESFDNSGWGADNSYDSYIEGFKAGYREAKEQ